MSGLNADEWLRGTSPALPDSDADGVSDGVEAQMGSDPRSVNSGTPRLQSRRQPVITWDSEVGRCYCVERATNLTDGFVRIATNVAATPPINSYTDDAVTRGGSRFYRIVEDDSSLPEVDQSGSLIAPASVDSPQRSLRRSRDVRARLRLVDADDVDAE